jgi:hypothetical protein
MSTYLLQSHSEPRNTHPTLTPSQQYIEPTSKPSNHESQPNASSCIPANALHKRLHGIITGVVAPSSIHTTTLFSMLLFLFLAHARTCTAMVAMVGGAECGTMSHHAPVRVGWCSGFLEVQRELGRSADEGRVKASHKP